MKKLTFWKSLFLLCALIVGTSTSWATDKTITITSSSVTNFPSGSSVVYGHYNWTVGDVSGVANCAKSSNSGNPLQFNYSATGSSNYRDRQAVYNTVAVPGKIKSIKMTRTTDGNNNRSWKVYASAAALTPENLSTATKTGGSSKSVTTSGVTWDFTGNNSYFYCEYTTGSACYIASIVVTYEEASSTQVATPNINGTQNFLTSTEVSITCDTQGAAIQYTTDNGETWNNYTEAFTLTETTTVKAKATKSGLDDSAEESKTFTKVTPLTVAEAIAATPSSGTSDNVYIHGIVSAFYNTSIVGDGTNYRYYISDDGTTTNQLLVFKGNDLNNVAFSDADDLLIGDEVIIYGGLTTYSSTKEVASGNYLVSRTSKPAPTFSLDITEKTLNAYSHEAVDVTLTTNTDGVISCESSNNDVATVALKSAGVYTITAATEGTATITISSAATANYKAASATVAITVTDTRADAGISFTEDEVETTFGEEFTGQALTNEHTLAVDWSSTDETVATVNTSGVVTVLKAGTTDIKATFEGNATYKAAVASYTLTVNKAAAGLSYATTNYNVDLFDNSFVAPALTNPNGLTVTYASDKTAVAEVNETTGAVTLHTNAGGKAIITASFVGNDNFLAGNASYTINVIDPSVVELDYNNNVFGITDSFVQDATLEYTANGITITLKQAGTENKPRIDGAAYTSADKVVRLYVHTNSTSGDNTMKVTAPAGSVITKIVFDFNKGSITENNNTYSQENTTWEGDAANVTFTAAAATFINKMTITLAPTVVVTDAKYASYVTTAATDFANTEGVTAYKVTAANATTITMESIDVAPKGTPVILKAVAETYALKLATSAPAAITDNLLQAGPVTGDGASYYVLGKDASNKLGFGLLKAGVELPATKAYLPVSAVGARVAFIPFDSETTAIDFVIAEPIDANAPMYNLAGQRVNKSYKGVVIVNGKKMLNK